MSGATAVWACEFLNRMLGAQLPMSDDDILADCACGTTRQLSFCLRQQAEDTVYRCPNCGGVLLVIAPVSGPLLPGPLHVEGDYQLWNPARLTFRGTAIPPASWEAAS